MFCGLIARMPPSTHAGEGGCSPFPSEAVLLYDGMRLISLANSGDPAMRRSCLSLLVVALVAAAGSAEPLDEVPAPFAPFEHMVGAWKGTATPIVNRVRGWPESHAWAWKFDKGKPVAMSVEWQGDKTLTKGLLTFNAPDKKYRLEGADADGKPVVFIGSTSTDGKVLTLDKATTAKTEAKERIIIRPNANKIRYVVQFDRQEPGAPQFKKQVEVGLTKAGESFAAGGGGQNLPKCIMTGGASTMTVSYQGKTYPVCCTGCRDEFNDNPAKYAQKADEAAQASPVKPGDKPAAAAVKGKDDGSFDGLFDDAKPKAKVPPR